MLTKTITILFLILSAYTANAQASNDSLPIFKNIYSYKLVDVIQQRVTTIPTDDKTLMLFVFLSPECPLCKNYTKTINALQQQFNKRVNIYGIVPGNAYTVKDVAAFQNKYHTTFKILIDAKQKLTHYLKASVTPQAILLTNNGSLVYTGAIDDWVQAQGKNKPQPTELYVQNAIEQSLQPTAVKVKQTKAFGCKINDY